MRTVIINRFSPSSVNYEEWLKDIDGEFIMITKPEHVSGFSEFFIHKAGFNDFDQNENIYRHIVELHEAKQIDYIIAAQEFDLLKAAQLREYLGLQGQSVESALAFRDKVFMKNLVKHSIQVPHFMKINHLYDVLEFEKNNGYPFVIKPIDNAGSMGVHVIHDKAELTEMLEYGLETNLEIETHVAGEMYHIDGLYQNGSLLLSRPSQYVNGCLAYREGNYVGSVLLDQNHVMYQRLNEAVHAILNVMPTPDHAISFHAEIFHTFNDELVFCEIACRVGGGLIVEAIEFATGINILKESIRSQCDGSICYDPTKNELVGFCVIPPKEGVLDAIDGDLPFEWVVESIIKTDKVGTKFAKAIASSSYVAMVLVKGESEEQIKERLDLVSTWVEEHLSWKSEEELVRGASV
ncbi:ATP-grasp domain-containing protein [Paenibacillus sp. FSL M7-0420]|uniref:ATP-grasp domain-containing protein n=1 Tax=Paenibacillus sp. FSL M7-0420 TaxID=2921609 RepID=UPI0030FC3530